MNHQPLLEIARQAAAAAAEVIQGYYQGDFDVRMKSDATPVTEADETAERIIRETISQAFPGHGFYGEELGRERTDAEVVWLIDPIDGTKSFVRGYPFFSTQIAASVNGERVVGVSSAPWMGEVAWAIKGQGAWRNDQVLKVSELDVLNQAILSTGNLESMATGPRWQKLGRLIPKLHRTRGYGDFYHYHLLAGGHIDAVVESDVNILDIAALAVIVEQAGGRFTDLDGGPVDLETRSVLASNGHLHDRLLEALADD
jgi:histidinol-phosphatase